MAGLTKGVRGPRSFLYEPRFRALVAQMALVVLVVLAGWYVYATVSANLVRLGVSSGFGFLSREGQFPIALALIDYSETSPYIRAFAVAVLNTLLVSVLAMATSLVAGFLLGIARLSRNWPLSRLAGAVVEINRNIPLLLHLLFWYFVVLSSLPGPRDSIVIGSIILNNRGLMVPDPNLGADFWLVGAAFVAGIAAVVVLAGRARRRRRASGRRTRLWPSALAIVVPIAIAYLIVGFPVTWTVPELRGLNYFGGSVLIPELLAVWVALTVYNAGYIAEIVRGGVLSVARVQREAADSIGLTDAQKMRLVTLPLAMRVIVPPLGNNLLSVIKESALGTAIGYPEIMQIFMGTVLFQTGQALEVTVITLVTYLAISLFVAWLIALYNRKIMRRGGFA